VAQRPALAGRYPCLRVTSGSIWLARRAGSQLAMAAVVELLHQHPLAADGEQDLQQQGPQQLLGRNRRPPYTEVLGVRVTVERIDLTDEEEIVTICTRDRVRQAISLLELPVPPSPPLGAEWIEAFRRWARGGR
jgi:hypothetical protein